MKVSFYPGCSLEGTAREYGESIEQVCETLDIEIEEIPGWNCCGASSAHCTNEFLSVALPARNLFLAERVEQDLVTPCAACFNRLKAAEKALTGASKMDVGISVQGKSKVLHILEFLTQGDVTERIEKHVKSPLRNLRVVSYYGCLIVRPPRITDAKHWEDPQALDRLIAQLGGESVFWPYKTECCGGSLVLTNVDIFRRLTGRLLDMAKDAEADCIVTCCPLCQTNLDTRQQEIGSAVGITYDLPIFYFTELMGLAFDLQAAGKWFRRHLVDPMPLLRSKNLM
jgi:heterodisulfide reductase subunit B